LRAGGGHHRGDLKRRDLLVEDLLDACLQLGFGRGLLLVELGVARVELDEAGHQQCRLVGDALDEGLALLRTLCRLAGASGLTVPAGLKVEFVRRHRLLNSTKVVALRGRVLVQLGKGGLRGGLFGPEDRELILHVGGLPHGRERDDGRLQEPQVCCQGFPLRRFRIGVGDAHELVE